MGKYIVRLVFSVVLLLAPLVMIGGFLILTPQPLTTPIQLQIQPGTGLNKIAHDLQAAGVVRSALAVRLLARWNQQGGRIQAGNYRFSVAATPAEILQRLVQGDVEKVSLTIPEGFTLQQIIEKTAEQGFGRKERLLALAYDADFIHSLGIEAASLEGYLFPETYLFAPGIGEKELLHMMVAQFRRHADSKLEKAAAKLGLTLHQWLTLASIIEKETAVVAEMPLISSVFHNRLKRKIPLQTDPTVIYGIKNFDGNITRKHLSTLTPYNTYLIRGLPPGPIASPGLAALEAAARPAATDFLYFVARGDGSHQFSKTLNEHNEAVRKYQLQRRR